MKVPKSVDSNGGAGSSWGLNDGAGGDNSSGRDAGVNEGRK